MVWVCDPYGGNGFVGHLYAFCRGYEDACVEVEIKSIKPSKPQDVTLEIQPSWKAAYQVTVDEYTTHQVHGDGDVLWDVRVEGISTVEVAKVTICYDEEPEPEPPEPDEPPENENAYVMRVGDSVLNIKLVRILCDLNQAYFEWGGRENLIGHVMKAVLVNPAIYVGVWWIDSKCSQVAVAIIDTTIPTVQEGEAKTEAGEIHPDATPEEIDEAWNWAKEQAVRDQRWKDLLEEYRNGTITYEQFMAGQLAIIKEFMNQRLFDKDFTLSIPSLVMAGEVAVSGTAPRPNQELQIVAVKKFIGFDWLAADDVLATVISDADNKYEATLNLDEFGIIEVYSRIPKAWWAVLTADITTTKRTVFVFTWEIIIFLLIAAALIWDKKTGKLGLLKKR